MELTVSQHIVLEALLPAVTVAGSMHPPSPTAVNDSAPRPGGRTFQTGGTAGVLCIL